MTYTPNAARLYVEGHNVRRGYAISTQLTDAECSKAASSGVFPSPGPVRFVSDLRYARRLVLRFNRRFPVVA